MSSTVWQNKSEGGSEVLIRLIVWFANTLGRRFCLLLLYPIALYFVIFDAKARDGVRCFHLARNDSDWTSVFRTFYVFAVTLLDRVYFAAGSFPIGRIQITGESSFREMLARHGRCILLGSHLGSFDVPLFLNESHGDEISVLMHHNQSSRLRGIAGISDDRFDVIQAGLPGSMLLAFDRLQKGGVLGVLGDRSNGSSDVLVSFLGRPISVTRAPYVLSYKAKSPIFLFFALYVGKGRYNVLFRQLTDGPDFDLSQDDFVSMLSQRYVNELACLARDYPENWFNFYNYFDSPSKHKNA